MDNNDHINNNIEEGGGGQQDEAPQQQQQHQILLSPMGQLLLSLLESHSKSELPPYVNNTIIEAVNDIAEEFVTKVRTSIVDILFTNKVDGPERQNRERGLTKTTIVDKDWHKTEKKIETAIRFFPDVVVEERYGFNPIQWMTIRDNGTNNYNLMSVSLIPIVVELGIEFQFDEELRGGLLSIIPGGTKNVLQQIICYWSKANENNDLLHHCFSAVRNWMRENNYLLNEDIQRYNLFGKLCTNAGFVSEDRVQYFIDWDPVILSMPCMPENGNFLPIHWSNSQKDIQVFSLLLKNGMQYYPEKFGFVFSEGTHQDQNGKIYRYTAFKGVCIKFGQEKVMNEIINRITEYCLSSTTASTSANNNVETSLLLSAITDDSIHLDAVFILVRKDPTTAFLRLQQQLQLLVGDKGHTDTDTSTETGTGTGTDNANNINNSNNNSDGVSNNNTDSSTSTSMLPSSDTIAAINVSSTTSNNNNNNDDDTKNNNADTTTTNRGDVTHEPSLPKGKKRKRKDEVV